MKFIPSLFGLACIGLMVSIPLWFYNRESAEAPKEIPGVNIATLGKSETSESDPEKPESFDYLFAGILGRSQDISNSLVNLRAKRILKSAQNSGDVEAFLFKRLAELTFTLDELNNRFGSYSGATGSAEWNNTAIEYLATTLAIQEVRFGSTIPDGKAIVSKELIQSSVDLLQGVAKEKGVDYLQIVSTEREQKRLSADKAKQKTKPTAPKKKP